MRASRSNRASLDAFGPPPTTALGRRIQTTRAGVTTYQVHSVGWQVIEDRIRPAGNAAAVKDLPVAAQYVWSPHYVDELILIDRDRNADGDLSDDGERLYVQQDANYNVTSVVGDTLTSGEGSEGFQPGVVERYQYDPYGQRTILDANWAVDADGVSDVQMVHGHQGGQHDVESHLVHFRHRDLNVVLGRWTRQDPLGYVDGGSLYEYVMSGPTRWVDPLGLDVSMDHIITSRIGDDRIGYGLNEEEVLGIETTEDWRGIFKVACGWMRESPKELANRIDEEGKKSGPFDQITIGAHGSPGQISIGQAGSSDQIHIDAGINSPNPNANEQAAAEIVDSIGRNLKPGGKVVFVACEAGLGRPGDRLREAIQERIGKGKEVILPELLCVPTVSPRGSGFSPAN